MKEVCNGEHTGLKRQCFNPEQQEVLWGLPWLSHLVHIGLHWKRSPAAHNLGSSQRKPNWDICNGRALNTQQRRLEIHRSDPVSVPSTLSSCMYQPSMEGSCNVESVHNTLGSFRCFIKGQVASSSSYLLSHTSTLPNCSVPPLSLQPNSCLDIFSLLPWSRPPFAVSSCLLPLRAFVFHPFFLTVPPFLPAIIS